MGLEAALPAGAGFWVDHRWGTLPWLTVAGVVLGLFVAGRHLFEFLRRLEREDKRGRGGPGRSVGDGAGRPKDGQDVPGDGPASG